VHKNVRSAICELLFTTRKRENRKARKFYFYFVFLPFSCFRDNFSFLAVFLNKIMLQEMVINLGLYAKLFGFSGV